MGNNVSYNINSLLIEDLSTLSNDKWIQIFNLASNKENAFFYKFTHLFVENLYYENSINFEILLKKCLSIITNITDKPYKFVNNHEANICIYAVRILTRLIQFAVSSEACQEFLWDEKTQIGNKIIINLTNLCFISGICIFPIILSRKSSENIYNDVLWKRRVGEDSTGSASNNIFDSNRTEILNCIIVSLSKPLMSKYPENHCKFSKSKDKIYFCYDKFLANFLDISKNKMSATLFYSIINTIISYTPVGYFSFPYSYAFSNDYFNKLLKSCFHLLLICLEKNESPLHELISPEKKLVPKGESGNMKYIYFKTDNLEKIIIKCLNDKSNEIDDDQTNIFYDCFYEKSFVCFNELLFNIFDKLLNSVISSQETYLPYSVQKIEIFQETLYLFWKLIEDDDTFLKFFVTKDTSKIVVPILFFMYIYRKEKVKTGLLHFCLYILLRLSSNREFSISLNKSYKYSLPINLPKFNGTVGDLLIMILHKEFLDCYDHRGTMFYVMFSIISNISPFLKKICVQSCNALIKLFERFSHPGFLFASQCYFEYVIIMMEIFNNFIQYQYTNNIDLIYCLIVNKSLFLKLTEINIEDNNTYSNNNDETYKISFEDNHFLKVIIQLINYLTPIVEGICNANKSIKEEQIKKALQDTSIVGIVSIPHKISIRSYKKSYYIKVWFYRYLWSIIYINNFEENLFDTSKVKIFDFSKNKIENKKNVENVTITKITKKDNIDKKDINHEKEIGKKFHDINKEEINKDKLTKGKKIDSNNKGKVIREEPKIMEKFGDKKNIGQKEKRFQKIIDKESEDKSNKTIIYEKKNITEKEDDKTKNNTNNSNNTKSDNNKNPSKESQITTEEKDLKKEKVKISKDTTKSEKKLKGSKKDIIDNKKEDAITDQSIKKDEEKLNTDKDNKDTFKGGKKGNKKKNTRGNVRRRYKRNNQRGKKKIGNEIHK